MYRYILVLYSFLSLLNSVLGQTSYLKGRKQFKVGTGFYDNLGLPDTYNNLGVFLEYNKGVNNIFEISNMFGIARYKGVKIEGVEGVYSHETVIKPTILYGVKSNVHILPLFLYAQNFRIDFYLSGKIGFNYLVRGKKFGMFSETEFDYGAYCGLLYRVNERLGFFCEYGRGYRTNFGFGISYITNK